jgi:hypothetical protein
MIWVKCYFFSGSKRQRGPAGSRQVPEGHYLVEVNLTAIKRGHKFEYRCFQNTGGAHAGAAPSTGGGLTFVHQHGLLLM